MGSLLTKDAVIELIKDSSRAIRRKIVKKYGQFKKNCVSLHMSRVYPDFCQMSN